MKLRTRRRWGGVGDELVGAFQPTVFFNQRNLRVPLDEVRLQHVLAE